MLALTLRGLAAHKRRLVSTVLAVLLGVAFMAGSLIFTDTMRATPVRRLRRRRARHRRAGPWTGDHRGFRRHEARAGRRLPRRPGRGTCPASPAWPPRVEGFAQVVDEDGKAVDDIGMGAAPAGAAWTEVAALNPFDLVAGRGPQQDDEVVVDRSLADEVGLAPGDRTTVLTPSGPVDARVVGVATFGAADNRAGNRTVLFTPDAAQRAAGSRRDGRQHRGRGRRRREPGAGRQGPSVTPLGGDLETITGAALTEENANRSNEDVDFFGIFMKVFAVVALLVGAFIINNTFAILVAQRTKELALLRAIGASGRQVRRSVTVEAAVVGTVASGLGLLAGVGVAKGIGALWRSFGVTMPEGPLVVSPSSLLLAFGVGLVVTVGSALLPARRAARVAPVAAMRDVAVEATRPSRKRIALGLLLTVGSVASVVGGITSGTVPAVLGGALAGFLGVATLSPVLARPVVRVLGARAAARHRGPRAARPRERPTQPAAHRRDRVSADDRRGAGRGHHGLRGVRQVVGEPLLRQGVPRRPRGRHRCLDVRRGQHRPRDRPAADRARRGRASPRRLTEAQVGDTVTEVAGWPAAVRRAGLRPGRHGRLAGGHGHRRPGCVDPARRGQGLGGRQPGAVRLRQRRRAYVRRCGRSSTTPTGPGRCGSTARLSRRPSPAPWTPASTSAARTAPATAALRQSVDAATAAYANVEVRDRAQMREQIVSEFNSMLGIVYALLALAILIALVGIANTMALSVVERTRELGLLRAVGHVPRPPARDGPLGGGADRGLRDAARARPSGCSWAGRWSSRSRSRASRRPGRSSRWVSWRPSS